MSKYLLYYDIVTQVSLNCLDCITAYYGNVLNKIYIELYGSKLSNCV